MAISGGAFDISEAKAKLSALMSLAIHEHAPVRVSRRGDDDQMVGLSRRQMLERLLSDETFPVEMTVDAGEFIAAVAGLGQLGTGPTVDAALLDLRDELDEFVTEFFSNLRFWEQTDRIAFYRPLLRYHLSDEDERLHILSGDDDGAAHHDAVDAVAVHADS